jgi:hypothetical protein
LQAQVADLTKTLADVQSDSDALKSEMAQRIKQEKLSQENIATLNSQVSILTAACD